MQKRDRCGDFYCSYRHFFTVQPCASVGSLSPLTMHTFYTLWADAHFILHQELHTLLSRRLSNTFMTAEDLTGAAPNEFEKSLLKQRDDPSTARSPFRIHRQTIMCSATIPQRQHFAQACLKNGWTANVPLLLHVSPGELLPKQVGHEVVVCPKAMRRACLKFLLKKELESWNADGDADSGTDGADVS